MNVVFSNFERVRAELLAKIRCLRTERDDCQRRLRELRVEMECRVRTLHEQLETSEAAREWSEALARTYRRLLEERGDCGPGEQPFPGAGL